ncbi:MAG: linear amide C-N hydrolase [Armatimonadetes bacterium]|nr:linear amide C-N hydrolase [Armatimonadota bacterium]
MGRPQCTLERICCLIALLAALTCPAEACSVFLLSDGGTSACGRNLDWDRPLPGAVIVNVRGVEKAVLPWKGSWPGTTECEPKTWVSRYGSVTLTCYGRDFIESGMNEAGLIVAEASLGASYPPDDGRPGVSCAQWMQYQLDSFATVDEALQHLDDLRPDGEGWHCLMADEAGSCAIIEHDEGKPVVYTGYDAPFCAITNTEYASALAHVTMDAAFGGDVDIAAGGDSYGRFVRIAALERDYDAEDDGAPADYAFKMLDSVAETETVRSVVFDPGVGRVTWRTRANRLTRWLDFGDLEFSSNAPVMMVGVEARPEGDASRLLQEYSYAANRKIVSAVMGSDVLAGDQSAADWKEATERELAERGLTLDEAIELIARNPEQ